MTTSYDVLIVGAGIFGVTAAYELNQRGYHVAILDSGPLPHPLAASTDISKVVRIEYGDDAEYMQLVAQASEEWLNWNERFHDTLYHPTGVTMLTKEPMQPGGYEYESYQLMLELGFEPERLNSESLRQRFPAWNAEQYVDGFYNPIGGYVESGRVIETLFLYRTLRRTIR